MSNIKIISDFSDFYDSAQDKNSMYVYRRMRCEGMQRGSALKMLRNLGIDTIDIKPVSYFYDDDVLLVYTNSKLHGGLGKIVMPCEKAKRLYSNCAASLLNMDSDVSIKYIRVGTRSFRVILDRVDKADIKYEFRGIEEIKKVHKDLTIISQNKNIPIYSIDYILSLNNSLIATDFNEVECLQSYNINKLMSSNDVFEEISKVLYCGLV